MSIRSHDVIVFLFFFCCVFCLPTDNIKHRHWSKYSTRPSARKACVGLRGGGRYIRNTPKRVFFMGALSAALRLRPRTMRVSAGSMIPSSHSLQRGRQRSASHLRPHSWRSPGNSHQLSSLSPFARFKEKKIFSPFIKRNSAVLLFFCGARPVVTAPRNALKKKFLSCQVPRPPSFSPQWVDLYELARPRKQRLN